MLIQNKVFSDQLFLEGMRQMLVIDGFIKFASRAGKRMRLNQMTIHTYTSQHNRFVNTVKLLGL